MFRVFSLLCFFYLPVLANENIGKMEKLLQEFPRDHLFTISQNGRGITFSQKIEVNNCLLTIKTFKDESLTQSDIYDLSRKNINKKLIPFKGTYVLDFGLNTIFRGRPTLNFSSKEEFDETYFLIKELVSLCHQSEVKKYYEDLRIRKIPSPQYIGSIPVGEERASGSVFTEGNEMTLLRGPDSFSERYRAITNAQKSIYLSQLFFRGDPVGLLFADVLIQKRMEGLDVRVMVSEMFNLVSNGDSSTEMENSIIAMRNFLAAGIKVHGVSCQGKLEGAIRGIDIFRILIPSHIKNWLIDSEDFAAETSISISGGMNVSARYFRLGRRLQWIDQDIGSKGPVLQEMRDRFLADFYERELHFRGKNDCFNPFDPLTQKEQYMAFKNAHTQKYKSPKLANETAEWEFITKEMSEYINNSRNSLEWVKVQGARYIMGRPMENENFILKAHIDLINLAKKEIIIANVFSLFVDEMKLALRRAIARGVKVRFLTNDPALYSDLPFVNILGRYYFRDLVYSNHDELEEELDSSLVINPQLVEISEWRATNGIAPVGKDTVMHNKYMIIDRKVGLVGSFNMDYASLKNPEQVLIFDNELLAQKLASYFENDHKYAKKLSLEEINSFRKPKDSGFLLFIAKLLKNSL